MSAAAAAPPAAVGDANEPVSIRVP